MAWPFLFEANPESGNFAADWSEGVTDTQSKAATIHYTQLANRKVAPYCGAYAWRIDLAGGTNDCLVQENTAFDLSSNGTWGLGFAFRAANDLVMAGTDRFNIWQMCSANSTVEACVGLRISSGTVQIIASRNASNSTVAAIPLAYDKWLWVESWGTFDTGGAGTINLAVDGVSVTGNIASQTQAAVTDAEFGAIGIDATTTAGRLYFGPVLFDNAQIGHYYPRYPRQRTITKSQHIFVGPGCLAGAVLLSGNNGDSMKLYDTDTGYSSVDQYQIAELSYGNMTSMDGPIYFQRGCYAVISGNNATDRSRGQAFISRGDEGINPPYVQAMYYSDQMVRQYAASRKRRPNNI